MMAYFLKFNNILICYIKDALTFTKKVQGFPAWTAGQEAAVNILHFFFSIATRLQSSRLMFLLTFTFLSRLGKRQEEGKKPLPCGSYL